MATLLFLGPLTMLLLGALVHLAATGGGPERTSALRSEGLELLRAWAGAGAPGKPVKQAPASAGDFSVWPERSGLALRG